MLCRSTELAIPHNKNRPVLHTLPGNIDGPAIPRITHRVGHEITQSTRDLDLDTRNRQRIIVIESNPMPPAGKAIGIVFQMP